MGTTELKMVVVGVGGERPWLSNEPRNPPVSGSPVLGVQACAIMPTLFTWVLGIKLKSSLLCSKHYTDKVVSTVFFFSVCGVHVYVCVWAHVHVSVYMPVSVREAPS